MSGKKGHGGKKGRSGRPRLPSAVKKMRGTYAPSRAAKNEVKVTLGRPDMPLWLDEEAQIEWRRIVPMLEEARVLADADKAMLADYCSAHSLAVRATKAYQKDGLTKTSKLSGTVKAHPLIAVAQRARAEAHRLAIEFGLSPASRSRVSAQVIGDDDGKPKDDAEDFIFGPPKLVVG